MAESLAPIKRVPKPGPRHSNTSLSFSLALSLSLCFFSNRVRPGPYERYRKPRVSIRFPSGTGAPGPRCRFNLDSASIYAACIIQATGNDERIWVPCPATPSNCNRCRAAFRTTSIVSEYRRSLLKESLGYHTSFRLLIVSRIPCSVCLPQFL